MPQHKRCVLKFGGTSVANIERIRSVAKIVKSYKEKFTEVIVVVSAMAQVTNDLVDYVNHFHTVDNKREYDSIVSAGEQISSGLLSLAIEEVGLSSKSLLSFQIPINTDDCFGNSKIISIETDKIEALLKIGAVPVIAGFQGFTDTCEITTLGRGGGDITAVAIAKSLKADECNIYTDVDGIYNADPRVISKAKKIDEIDTSIIVEMAYLGAKVLNFRAAEIAYKHNIKVNILSTFNAFKGGTKISREDLIMEKPLIESIITDKNQVFVAIYNIFNSSDIFTILEELFECGITIDMMSTNTLEDTTSNLFFSINLEFVNSVINILEKNATKFKNFVYNTEVTKLSILGSGVSSNTVIMKKLMELISKEKDVNIILTGLSGLKISFLINKNITDNFANKLYNMYENFLK